MANVSKYLRTVFRKGEGHGEVEEHWEMTCPLGDKFSYTTIGFPVEREVWCPICGVRFKTVMKARPDRKFPNGELVDAYHNAKEEQVCSCRRFSMMSSGLDIPSKNCGLCGGSGIVYQREEGNHDTR